MDNVFDIIRKTQLIIVNSQKGGVLKTTIASNIASILSLKSKKVLLVDLDSQNDISISFNINAEKHTKTIYEVLVEDLHVEQAITEYSENLHLLLSNSKLEDYEIDTLLDEDKSKNYQYILQEKLKPLYGKYDYIIIDSSPSYSILTLQMYMLDAENGLNTEILIPYHPELYALKNLVRQTKKVNKFKKINDKLNIKAIIPTKIQSNNTHKTLINQVKQMFSVTDTIVTETEIRNSVKFTEYLLVKNRPVSLEDDKSLTKEYKQFKDTYLELLEELDFESKRSA